MTQTFQTWPLFRVNEPGDRELRLRTTCTTYIDTYLCMYKHGGGVCCLPARLQCLQTTLNPTSGNNSFTWTLKRVFQWLVPNWLSMFHDDTTSITKMLNSCALSNSFMTRFRLFSFHLFVFGCIKLVWVPNVQPQLSLTGGGVGRPLTAF